MRLGFIYKLSCTDGKYPEIYVGSTEDLCDRDTIHARDTIKSEKTHENIKLYKYIRESGGYEKWSMDVIERVEFDNRDVLLWRERFHMEALNASLNMIKLIISEEERKAHHKKARAKWAASHKEELLLYSEIYNAEHAVHLAKCSREWEAKNSERRSARRSEQIVCACGQTHSRGGKNSTF